MTTTTQPQDEEEDIWDTFQSAPAPPKASDDEGTDKPEEEEQTLLNCLEFWTKFLKGLNFCLN